jgi:nucleotide-binding universal stress UspA family protein
MIPPRKILLATDFSSRSDRAQDRAVSLMKEYNAGLVVLNVIEPVKDISFQRRVKFSSSYKPNERLIEKTRWQMLDYLKDNSGRVTVRIENGNPAEIILQTAKEENCDLIVIGVARNEILGRFILGKTVEKLIKNSHIPLLIVTGRVRSPYWNIVIASDFSAVSKKAFETAIAYFPEKKMAILNAHAAPGSYAVDDHESYREQIRQMIHRDYTTFINAVEIPETIRERLGVLIEWGSLPQLLKELVYNSSVELVVLGSRNRGLFRSIFRESNTMRIITSLPCDALVVRGES